jgi:hypothetical protein
VRLDVDGSEASFKQRDLLELNDGLGAPLTFGSDAGRQAAAQAQAAARAAEGDRSDDDDGVGGPRRSSRARHAATAAAHAAAQAAAQAALAEKGMSDDDDDDDDGDGGGGSSGSEAGGSFGSRAELSLPSGWICCDACNKWRRVPGHVPLPAESDEWRCELNSWDLFNRCWVDEEPGALEPTDDEGSSDEEGERAEGAGQGAGHSAGLGRRRPADLVRGAELSAVLVAGADAVWALPKGRLVCWVEGRAYAVAHSGETLAQVT